MEARLDFEEDLPPLDLTQVTENVKGVKGEVETALQAAERAVVAHAGMLVSHSTKSHHVYITKETLPNIRNRSMQNVS